MNTVTGVIMWLGLSWLKVGASDGPRQHGDVLLVGGGSDRSWELPWGEERLLAYQNGLCYTELLD